MGWGGPATSPHSPGPITHHQAEVSQPPTRPPRQSQEMTRLIHNWGLETAVLGPETCGALAVCSPDRIFRAMTEDDEGGMEASRSTTKIFVWGLGPPNPLLSTHSHSLRPLPPVPTPPTATHLPTHPRQFVGTRSASPCRWSQNMTSKVRLLMRSRCGLQSCASAFPSRL